MTMGSLANVLANLQTRANKLVTGMATDSAFILRRTLSSNSKGGQTGAFSATTATAHPCFYQVMTRQQADRYMAATQYKAGTFYEFVFRSDVDVKATDRIQLVANRGVAQKEMAILNVADQIGLSITVVAFEETPL